MTATVVESSVTEIPVARCAPHPLNRKRFDPAKLKELAESIAQGGLWTPILVRPDPDQAGHYQIVAGERRWRAHQQLERTRILAIVRELTDEQAIEALVVENAQREDPHPLEEADGYAALMDVSQGRITVPELAARVGKSASYILQRLKLRELGDEGRAAFWENRIPFSHALVVARLPKERQGEALTLAFGPDHYSDEDDAVVVRPFREFAEEVRDKLHLPLKVAPFSLKDEGLCPGAGSCIACPKRTGFAPELFPEITKKDDECTDRTCWDAKVKAHIADAIDAARTKHGDALVLLTTGYKGGNPPAPGKPLCQSYWREATKDTKGAVPGLLTRDDFGGSGHKLGKVLWVTVKKPEKAAAASDHAPPSREKFEADQAKREAALATEVARRERLLTALLAKVTKLTPALRNAALLGLRSAGSLHTVTEFSALPDGGGPREINAVAKLSDAAWAKEVVIALASEDLVRYQLDNQPAFLLALAKELKVDAKKVMADPPAPTGAEKPTPAAKAKGKK